MNERERKEFVSEMKGRIQSTKRAAIPDFGVRNQNLFEEMKEYVFGDDLQLVPRKK